MQAYQAYRDLFSSFVVNLTGGYDPFSLWLSSAIIFFFMFVLVFVPVYFWIKFVLNKHAPAPIMFYVLHLFPTLIWMCLVFLFYVVPIAETEEYFQECESRTVVIEQPDSVPAEVKAKYCRYKIDDYIDNDFGDWELNYIAIRE